VPISSILKEIYSGQKVKILRVGSVRAANPSVTLTFSDEWDDQRSHRIEYHVYDLVGLSHETITINHPNTEGIYLMIKF